MVLKQWDACHYQNGERRIAILPIGAFVENAKKPGDLEGVTEEIVAEAVEFESGAHGFSPLRSLRVFDSGSGGSCRISTWIADDGR